MHLDRNISPDFEWLKVRESTSRLCFRQCSNGSFGNLG
jgi:hypothetical protein